MKWEGDDPTERAPYLVEITDAMVYNPQSYGECEYNVSLISQRHWDLSADLGFAGRGKVLPVLYVF